MKKLILSIAVIVAFGVSSCKKDRVCTCTNTHTASNGNVTTDPMQDVTYKDVKKMEAKDLCQKTTQTYVNSSGGTTTDVYDCKLK